MASFEPGDVAMLKVDCSLTTYGENLPYPVPVRVIQPAILIEEAHEASLVAFMNYSYEVERVYKKKFSEGHPLKGRAPKFIVQWGDLEELEAGDETNKILAKADKMPALPVSVSPEASRP